MNPAWGQVAGVVTLTLLLVFIGIWVWAWRPRHRRKFDAMARMPMSDADTGAAGDQDSRR
jgi:cytochrome c oxidase cbb3-type subunit 4